MSNARMGKRLSAETIEKIRQTKLGTHLSDATRALIGKKNKKAWDEKKAADPNWEPRKAEARKRANTHWRANNPNYKHEQRVEHPKRFLLMSARARAKKKGFAFDLTEDDIEVPKICPALGIPIVIGATPEQRWNAPSIDRIDSSKGYEKENVVVVSYRANILKNAATVDEMRRLLAFYEQFEVTPS